MRLEELAVICLEAAGKVVSRTGVPIPATVVLPLPSSTQVVTLEDFPSDDAGRLELIERFVQDRMRPENAPCYGFVAGAEAHDGDESVDVVMVVYGARNHHPQVTAAAVVDDAVGEFAEAEDLVIDAMPFLAPLQRAADAAVPPDVMPTEEPGGSWS